MSEEPTEKKNADLTSLRREIDFLWNCLIDLKEPGNSRRVSAFWNIVTYGRMVTFHLQKLLSGIPGFDEWYAARQTEMKNDELLRFFKHLRNTIEKEGFVHPSNVAYISHFEYPKDLQRFGPPPPGAKGFFIGDQYGGSGWNVEGPDGRQFKIYVDLPPDIGNTWMSLEDMPKVHQGKNVYDNSLESVCTLYIDYLKNLVEEAFRRVEPKL